MSLATAEKSQALEGPNLAPLTAPFYLHDKIVKPLTHQLIIHGQEITLQPKLMEVLLYLCQRAGNIVSAEDMIQACWPRQVISDGPIHKTIAQLRKVLGDSSRNSSFIKTVPRSGYILIAPIAAISQSAAEEDNRSFNSNPYPGLVAYGTNQQKLFCGRDQVIYELLKWINSKASQESNWLNVVAGHGTGKSSLMQAGLAPALQTLALDEKNHLAPPLLIDLRQTSIISLDKQLPTNTPSNITQVILIDNLDTLLNERLSPLNTEPAWQQLAKLSSQNYRIVSFLDSAQLPLFERRCPEHQLPEEYHLPGFTQAEMFDVVRKPMAAAGIRYSPCPEARELLDITLVQQWHKYNLPIQVVQETLFELYHLNEDSNINYRHYMSLGGFSGTLCQLADACFHKSDKTTIDQFEKLLLQLLSLNSAGDSVIPAPAISIEKAVQFLPQSFLMTLVRSGVLCFDLSSHGQTVRFAQELLLKDWSLCKNWLGKHSQQLYAHHDLKVQTERWLYHHKKTELLTASNEVLKRFVVLKNTPALEINEDQQTFIKQSKIQVGKRKRLKLFAAITISITLCCLSWLSYNLNNTATALEFSKSRAENLLSFILHDLEGKLTSIGKIELLDMVGKKALDYFDSEGTENLNNRSLAQWSKALIILGEGQMKRNNNQSASVYFNRANTTIQTQLSKSPTNIDLLEQAMLCQYWLGYIHYTDKEYEQAKLYFNNYLNFATQLETLNPALTKWTFEKSYALNNLGSASFSEGKLLESKDFFENSAKIKESLLGSDLDQNLIKSELADTYSWIGTTHQKLGNLETASKNYLMARSIAKDALESNPDDMVKILWLSSLEFKIATNYFFSGNNSKALSHAIKSDTFFSLVTENDPTNIKILKNSAKTLLLIIEIRASLNIAADQYASRLDNLLKQLTINGDYSIKEAGIEAKSLMHKIKFLDHPAHHEKIQEIVSEIEILIKLLPEQKRLTLEVELYTNLLRLQKTNYHLVRRKITSTLNGKLEQLSRTFSNNSNDFRILQIYFLGLKVTNKLKKESPHFMRYSRSDFKPITP